MGSRGRTPPGRARPPTAFAARAHPAAGVLVAVGRRHEVSAVSLRAVADALEAAQRIADAAVAEHEVALPRAIALGNARVEAEQSADPTQHAVAVGLHHREIAELERVQGAERRHAAAWQGFQDADRRCAAVLRALLEDGLADSRTYDTLTATSRAAAGIATASGAVALLPVPPARAVGLLASAAGGVGLVADVTVKLAYGDGDWSSIGLTAAASSTGGLAKVLKRGALATNPAARLATTRGERRLLRPDVTARLKLGLAGELRRSPHPGGPRRVHLARARPATGSPVATAHWLAEQVGSRTAHAVRVRWLDDLALATRDPARSRTMFVTGLGAEGASTGLGGGAVLREHQLDGRQAEEEERRDRRFGAGGR